MLLGFKERFADPIRIGTKVHTLRSRRKKDPKIGETLHMYSGLRTRNCAMISKNERLVSRQKAWIKIVYKMNKRSLDIFSVKVCVDGKLIGEYHRYGNKVYEDKIGRLEEFVKYDGFNNVMDFALFWISSMRAQIRKANLYGQLLHTVESKDLYHWTDLRY